MLRATRAWGPFLESPERFSGQKSFRKTPIRLLTATFRASRRLRFEDTKIIMSPEKFRDFRETGPWTIDSFKVCHYEVQLSPRVSLPKIPFYYCFLCAISVDYQSTSTFFNHSLGPTVALISTNAQQTTTKAIATKSVQTLLVLTNAAAGMDTN